jgi:hypothetical protein
LGLLTAQQAVEAREARYEQGPFPLPASPMELLTLFEAELRRWERRAMELGASAGEPAG